MKVLNFSRKPPSLEAVQELEAHVGCALDPSFLDWLQQNNGGSPKRRMYEDSDRELYVQVFFPLASEVRNNILSESRLFDLPRFHAIIAIVGSGDRLVLDADGGDIHLMEEGRIIYLAADIVQFAERLVGDEEPDGDAIVQLAKSGDIERLRRFVADGNNIDERSGTGSTIVQMAAQGGDLPMVKACVELGASLDGVREKLRKVARFDFLKLLEELNILQKP